MRKTTIRWDDRDWLLARLRPFADEAPDRCNLTLLTDTALNALEAGVEAASDHEETERLLRIQRNALGDRIYTELDMMLKAKTISIMLPFSAKPIKLKMRQGVRSSEDNRFHQIPISAFNWGEYDSWRERVLTSFAQVASKRDLVRVIDQVRMINPTLANPWAALRLSGASIGVQSWLSA